MNQDAQPNPQPDSPRRPQHVSARVPERVSPGVFSTGVIVMTGGTEFVIDFVQNLGQPAQVAARVVMPHATMPQFIEALRTNLDLYTNRFGNPPEIPRSPPPARQPTIQEIYDDLKLPEDVAVGSYANGVMIGHAASEFKFDFLANMVPHPSVSCRVYLAAPQVPRMLESLKKTYEQFQQRVQQQQKQQQQQPPRPPQPPADEGDSDPPTPPAEPAP
jgi:hypothetical protein